MYIYTHTYRDRYYYGDINIGIDIELKNTTHERGCQGKLGGKQKRRTGVAKNGVANGGRGRVPGCAAKLKTKKESRTRKPKK